MRVHIRENSALIDIKTSLKLLENGNLLYIREPLSFFRIHENQDQCSLKRVMDARYNWLKLFSEYTKTEQYIPRHEAEKFAYDFIVPMSTEGYELFHKKLSEEEMY